MDRRRLSSIVIAGIAAALILGLLIGVSSGLADRLFSGPKPETIASASLESMRAQNRLIAFVARYVSVTSSRTSRFGFSAEATREARRASSASGGRGLSLSKRLAGSIRA